MAMGDNYADLDDLKDYLGLEGESAFDDRLNDALNSSSRAIERFCGRVFNRESTATARVFYPTRPRLAFIDDFHTDTDLEVKTDEDDDGTFEEEWAASDYQLEPLNGMRDMVSGWPYFKIRAIGSSKDFPCHENGRAPLQVTAQWGWAEVPSSVKQSCLIMAAETFKLAGAPLGVAGFGEFGVVRVRDNRQAAARLAPYVRGNNKIGMAGH